MLIKRSKYLYLVVVFVVTIFMFAGCGNDFMEVASVTFTTSGETRTINSYWYLIHGTYTKVTQEEYNAAKFKTSVLAGSDVNVDTLDFYTSDVYSGNIYNVSEKPYKPYNITIDNIGEYFYIYAHDLGSYNESYYKTEIIDVGANYLQVKVVNNTTIIVKFGVNETTYTVTSYRIRK